MGLSYPEVDISVVLPVYNGKPFLAESVESVLGQEHQNFEFVIIDDCSTDGSYEYLQTLPPGKVRLIRNEHNRGLFANLNVLVENSRGRLIKLWSQDDIMEKDALIQINKFHDKYPNIGFSYCAVERIDENGNVKESNLIDETPELIDRKLHTKIAFYTGSIAGNIANVTINRTALERVGVFNEQMKIAGDTEMWFRLAEYFPVGHINEKLIRLRDHDKQFSRQKQYYLYHLKEELECFSLLIRYADKQEVTDGMKMLRRRKLQFYVSIMIRLFLSGKFSVAAAFYRNLSRFDSMSVLLIHFFLYRVLKLKLRNGV